MPGGDARPAGPVNPRAAIADTNVVVAGPLTAEAGAPTTGILDGMR